LYQIDRILLPLLRRISPTGEKNLKILNEYLAGAGNFPPLGGIIRGC